MRSTSSAATRSGWPPTPPSRRSRPRSSSTTPPRASRWWQSTPSTCTARRAAPGAAASPAGPPTGRRRSSPSAPARSWKACSGRCRRAMPVRKYKPTSPGRRFMATSSFEEITANEPEKTLLESLPAHAGRNNQGRITVRHRGGEGRRQYRKIDFKRDKLGVPAKVASIEYDPNRSARIALLFYADGEKRYILAPQGIKVGDRLMSGPGSDIRPGNALPLSSIPVGTVDHAVELKPGAGAKMARSAGSGVQLLAKEGGFATLRLPSGEIRLVDARCRASVGEVGNPEHELVTWGKAGRSRWRGKRPSVRGVAMNPVDHPLGGGEGKSSGGRHPTSPWGKKEGRTRKPKASDKLIVRRRGKRRG